MLNLVMGPVLIETQTTLEGDNFIKKRQIFNSSDVRNFQHFNCI